MEVPEVTEFDVYLDIDGAVEEDEDTVQSESGDHCAVPLDSGEQNNLHPWQPLANGHESGSGASSTTLPDTQEDECVASTSRHSVRLHDSDNEEVDVDTPYDGKLFGQTQVKSEPSSQTLLSTLLSYTSMSSLSSVPKKPAVPKKIAVAKKSTTQKKSGLVVASSKSPSIQKGGSQSLLSPESQQGAKKHVSNVAKKSTSKQPKLMTSNSGGKSQLSKEKTGNVLQVKFGPGKYLSKAASYTSSKGFSKMSTLMKKSLGVSKKVGQETQKTFALGNTSPVALPISTSQGKKMFPCCERSGDKIACPECSIVVKTYCLRSHLKTVHNLPMKNCKRCKITFTDLNLYSEHYAHHLQEQEDNLESQTSSKQNVAVKSHPQAVESSQAEESRNPAVINSQPASTVTKASSGVSRFPNEVPPLSNETKVIFRSKPHQIPASVKKRKFSSFSSGPSPKFPKLMNESAANKITYPFHSKLPPKPRKPSFQSKKRFSSFHTTKQAASVLVDDSSSWQSEESDTVIVPVKPKLPAKPRKPFSPSKMKHLYSSGRRDSGSSRERRSSTASVQSESTSESSETARPTSTLYKENRKMANRRPVLSTQDLPPLKKTNFDVDAASATPTTKKYRGKATVSLVSLETASRPYDCKKCLAAFHTALSCPRAFRQHSQNKPYACINCPAVFTQPEQLRIHQDTLCSAVVVKREHDDELSFHTSLRRHRVPSSPQSQELAQNVPAKSHGKGALYQCHKCKETFQYRSLLLRHIPYHSYQYSCGICKKAYVQKVDLLNHLQIMHDGRMSLRCKYCETKFEDISEFDNHILTHKDGTVVSCTVCGEKFSSSRQMQIHLTVSHGVSQKSDCETCGKRFKQAKLLAIHMRVVHKTAKSVIICKVCGRRFKQAKLLSVHMKVAHKTAKPIVTKFLSCRYCHKVFHNKQGLAAHYKLRHGVSLFFAMTAESMKSVKNAHDASPNPSLASSQTRTKVPSTAVKVEAGTSVLDINGTTCQICGKKYSKRKVLVSHYRHVHRIEPTGTQPDSLKCHICGKVVYSLQGLKVHYKVRHRRRIPQPAAVSEDPKPAASTAPSTAASTSTKSRCRCDTCGKYFLYTWSLYRHQRLYHRNSVQRTLKPNPVPVQGKQSHLSLKADTVSFQKRQPWICSVCGKSFRLRKSMRMHIKTDHPKNFTDERFGGRKCHKCKKAFGSKTKLLLHLKTCGVKGRGQKQNAWIGSNRYGEFKCTMCGKIFHWRQNMMRHMQNNHKLSKEVITYNMKHQKLAQSEKSYPSQLKLCETCKVCFTGRESLSRHQRRRHGGISSDFQCRRRACKKGFMRNEALLHHIKTAHPDMSIYWCQGCNSGFDTSSDLFSHRCFHTSQSHISASSWHGGDEYAQESLSSFSAEQECRYRCMTCDMGFHMAREWTKHMQEHTENIGETSENAAYQEQMMGATDKVRLSMFDVLSGSSIFSCKFCRTVFNNENEMNLHICQQPTTTNTGPKKAKRKRNSRNLEPVKCTVCLKLFSPLSIKKHMMRIHSLPMRICSKCNIVFTDLERFKRHNEHHNQHEGSQNEEVAVATSADDEFNDDSVTFFICQACGGLFSDADSLGLHECVGENIEETSANQHESEDDLIVNALEYNHGKSNETDTSGISDYFSLVSQPAEGAAIYAGSKSGSEGITESQTIKTLCEDESDYAFQTRIVIESVSSGAAVESDASGYGKEGTLSNTERVIKMGNENISSKELVPSFNMSMEDVLTSSPPETLPTAPETSKLLISHSDLEEPGEQMLCDSTHSLSVKVIPSYDSSEAVITSLENTDTKTAITGVDKMETERAEITQSNLGEETSPKISKIIESEVELEDPEVRQTIQCEKAYPETCGTAQCEKAGPQTCETAQFAKEDPESSETAQYEANPESSETANYEEADPESSETAQYETNPESSETANYEADPESSETAQYEANPESSETANYEEADPGSSETAQYETNPESSETANYEEADPESSETAQYETNPESSETANYEEADPESSEIANYEEAVPESRETANYEAAVPESRETAQYEANPESRDTAQYEADPESSETANYEEADPKSSETARYEADPESSETAQYEVDPESSETAQYEVDPESSETAQYEADPESSETANYEEAVPESSETAKYEGDPESSETAQYEKADPESSEAANYEQAVPESSETAKYEGDPESSETARYEKADPESSETAQYEKADPQSCETARF